MPIPNKPSDADILRVMVALKLSLANRSETMTEQETIEATTMLAICEALEWAQGIGPQNRFAKFAAVSIGAMDRLAGSLKTKPAPASTSPETR